MSDGPTRMSKVIPKTLSTLAAATDNPEEAAFSSGYSHSAAGGGGSSPRRTKMQTVGNSVKDLKMTFFNRNIKDSGPTRKLEDIGISFYSLRFSNLDIENRFAAARGIKYQTRLRFGAAFTAFFIPLLVIMQVSFKKDDSEKWARVPLVMIFPGK